jgi:Immunity protein 40
MLPDPIREAGTSLHAQHVNEVAFPVSVAHEILDVLAESGTVVLGGDFWKKINDHFRPTYVNWYAEPEPNESLAQFAARSIQRAREEINRRSTDGYFVTFTCRAQGPGT